MSRYAPDADGNAVQSRFQDPVPQPDWPHNKVDLHTHTDRSDGVLPPAELYQAMADCGLEVVSISDHDTLAGYRSLRDTAVDPRWANPHPVDRDQQHRRSGADPDGRGARRGRAAHPRLRRRRGRCHARSSARGPAWTRARLAC